MNASPSSAALPGARRRGRRAGRGLPARLPPAARCPERPPPRLS